MTANIWPPQTIRNVLISQLSRYIASPTPVRSIDFNEHYRIRLNVANSQPKYQQSWVAPTRLKADADEPHNKAICDL